MEKATGWRMKPVCGILSQREFLNGLAYKVHNSTVFLRHHANPFYAAEPDLIHEFLGHVPMYLNQDFADFCQMLGVASLGATD
jgi:phenylalanine-4-hydroxylase